MTQLMAMFGSVAVGILGILGPSSIATDVECPIYFDGIALGITTSKSLDEASGLAASRKHTGVLWTHNDSGDGARFYAMDLTGVHLGRYRLDGASGLDWEDMAIGPGPVSGVDYLYFGDIGDNANVRPNIRVLRVPEPAVDWEQDPVDEVLSNFETIRLVYPDGPRDAETLMVDTNGDLYLVSKRVGSRGRVYRAPFPQSTKDTITLDFVAELPWHGATGGDIATDGSAVIVRRYTSDDPQATLWPRGPGQDLADAFLESGCDLELIAEPQGEAICFVSASISYLTLSEQVHQPIYLYKFENGCPGDLDRDTEVDFRDMLILLSQWGPYGPCPPYLEVDIDQNCEVAFSDLLALLAAWGPCK